MEEVTTEFLGSLDISDIKRVNAIADILRPENIWITYNEAYNRICLWKGKPTPSMIIREFWGEYMQDQQMEAEEGNEFTKDDFLMSFFLIEKGGKEICILDV